MVTIEDYFAMEDLEENVERTGDTLSPVRSKVELEEEIKKKIDKCTEITITYKNELIEQWNDGTLKDITEKVLRRVLQRCKIPKTAVICLIGEHSPVGRFHYHGVFCGIANDKISSLKRACTRHLGRTEIKMISFPESYIKYIFKAYSTMAELPEQWCYPSYITINI